MGLGFPTGYLSGVLINKDYSTWGSTLGSHHSGQLPNSQRPHREAALDVLHLVPKGRAAVLGAEEITYHGSIKPEARGFFVSQRK